MSGLRSITRDACLALEVRAEVATEPAELRVAYSARNHGEQSIVLLNQFYRPGQSSPVVDPSNCFHLIEDDTLVLAKYAYTGIWVSMYVPIWPSGRRLRAGGEFGEEMRIPLPVGFWNPWLGRYEKGPPIHTCRNVQLCLGYVLESAVQDVVERPLPDGGDGVRVPFEMASERAVVLDSERIGLAIEVANPLFAPALPRRRFGEVPQGRSRKKP